MRTRLFIALVVALAATFALAGIALADGGGRPITTALSGAAEVPGPGDPNATGTASLRLNPGQQEVCLDVSWAAVDGEVFAGHIHAGTATVVGPVVVTLFTGSFAGTDSVSGCVAANRALILDIIRNPENYYVNVHSRPNFPAGAVRGQLG
jgi:ABC-type antimicrobial peptide transport system permease subunit